MSRRAAAWLAWSVCAAALTLLALTLLLIVLGSSTTLPRGWDSWPEQAINIVRLIGAPILGGLIASRRPENPYGWLWLGFGVGFTLGEFAYSYAAYALVAEPGSLPIPRTIGTLVGNVGWVVAITLAPFVLLLFPTGRLPSRRWRFLAWVVLTTEAAMLPLAVLLPGGSSVAPFEHPFAVGGAAGAAITTIGTAVIVVVFAAIILSALSLVARYRRADGIERQQLKWFALAAVLIGGFIVADQLGLGRLLGDALWNLLEATTFVGLYAAVGIAILRYRLYDIDVIINRTLVYGALSAILIGIYLVVAGYLGTLFRTEDSVTGSLITAGIVAVLFAPLRDRLQQIVNRLMYGERDDPYKVLSDLGERLESTLTPDAVLPTITETVAGALKLPYAAMTVKHDGEHFVEAAEYGKKKKEAAAELFSVPLTYQKEKIGELLLAPRSPGEALTKPDLKLLENVARQAGIAVYAVRLAADLQRSRERLVAAREEERRRLRRDLHDSVGPQLAALTLELETASELVSDRPEASAFIAKLSERARQTVADVRRSVHALRPPSLDELGLVPALREAAAQYERGSLRVSVEAPEELPPLPAAVEVACYRIAQEAMTNAVRHAHASNCWVRLVPQGDTDALIVEVEDDGRGIGENDRAGVGMSSMRERAEELGGRCVMGPSARGGTLVRALLPCPGITDGTDRRGK